MAVIVATAVICTFEGFEYIYRQSVITRQTAVIQNEAVLIAAEYSNYESLEAAENNDMNSRLSSYSALNQIRIRIVNLNYVVSVDTYSIDTNKTILNPRVFDIFSNPKVKMRTKVIMTICLFLLMVGKASAQWSVIDPTNIAQSIINSSNNIVHTSSTAQNMINNFKETVKIYEQGKKYYDALKSVNNLVKDARKVQQTILMVGDITDIYINNYQKMMHDDNFSVEELSAIGFGYTKLLEESNDVLTELKNVVNITTLSMTDKERMDVVERCYSKMKRYRNLVSYYTNKNISVSYLRAKKKNDLDRIMGLYGKSNEKYW